MNYVSHEDYKQHLADFEKQGLKDIIKEGMEEGNAFTAALAKAKKGEKVKVGDREVTDTSDYDNPSVTEDGYADNYAGSWGYREGRKEEGLNPAPMQATGQTISTVENTVANPPYGFSALSPDERKQLKEYIESVKTIKKEIAKLAAKAGKKIKEEGGNRTGLVMNTGVVSED